MYGGADFNGSQIDLVATRFAGSGNRTGQILAAEQFLLLCVSGEEDYPEFSLKIWPQRPSRRSEAFLRTPDNFVPGLLI